MLENKLMRPSIKTKGSSEKEGVTTAKINSISDGNPEDALLTMLDLESRLLPEDIE